MKSFLILLAIFAYFPSAHADDFQKKIEALAAESAKAGPQCESYLAGLKKAEHGSRAAREHYKTKGTAIAVLDILEKHPGTPEATAQVRELLAKEPLDKYPSAWVLAQLKKTSDFCAPVDVYNAIQKLLESSEILLFSKDEKARVKSFLLGLAQKELRHPASTMLHTSSLASALLKASESKIVGLDKASLKAITQKANRTNDELRKRPDSADKVQYELRESGKLNQELQKLVEKIK
jgi:hypothetical protein